jgi:hypothetical protein
MGYWGFEPKSGDAPLDEFAVIEDAMKKHLKKLYKPKHPHVDDRFTRVGFVQLCYESHLPIPIDFMEKAVEDLRVCVLDPDFIGDWGDPDLIVVNMQTLIEAWEEGIAEEKARTAGTGIPREYQTVQLDPCITRPGIGDDEEED